MHFVNEQNFEKMADTVLEKFSESTTKEELVEILKSQCDDSKSVHPHYLIKGFAQAGLICEVFGHWHEALPIGHGPCKLCKKEAGDK